MFRCSWKTTATSRRWAYAAGTQEQKPRHKCSAFCRDRQWRRLILNGELLRWIGHTAGEVGHMVLEVNGPKCGCGNKGCFEALASRTAIFKRIKAG